jgi:hypothetical protein
VHRFDTFIVRDDCVIDLNALQRHPNVQHLIRMPQGWVVYEFHHELFKDPDFLVEGVWREKMERLPGLRESRIQMLQQEQSLLAPWYAKKKRPGNADGVLASPVCTYHISSLGRMRWIDFVPDEGWGSAREFTLALEAQGATIPAAALQLLEEWLACGKQAGELSLSGTFETKPRLLLLRAKSSAYSGHWLAALWALLSDARLKTGLHRMRITVTQ